MSNFSERLRQAMQSKGMSAIQLSEATGISRGAISNYLSGRYKSAQTNTFNLAMALDVDPAWLMGKDIKNGSRIISPIFGENRYDPNTQSLVSTVAEPSAEYGAENVSLFTDEEYDVIDMFRSFDDNQKQAILQIMRSMRKG